MKNRCKIDTMQLKIKNEEIASCEGIKVMSKDKEGSWNVKMHLSKLEGEYEGDNYSYFKQMKKFDEVLQEIAPNDEITITRIDICFDFLESFNEMLAYGYILSKIYQRIKGKGEIIFIVSDDTNKITSMEIKTSSEMLYIYDKEKESCGKHAYKTRVEMRLMRKSIKDIEKVWVIMDKIIEGIIEIANMKLDEIMQEVADDLVVRYEDEKAEGKVKNLSEFVRKYKYKIVVRDIMERLYEQSGMQGKIRDWLNKYRRTNNIKFEEKKEIQRKIEELQMMLKAYLNS
ncbi:hypothetical protein AN640_01665 [Candidatus Epulonipiscium fishelsonii]|uniref:Uncharacterized protein n=1 Tax=Candidatus Epulonipiscium fishelsonii TaxID=77094 RepID=A0ACC8XBN6_9FIRM|nr:hypothetical protein AN640_01665 [Epulopiscium sp. SCG-D08WGA-EpuloA1]